jgi:hypothetical protein
LFDWESYKAEIDAGRPVVLIVQADGDYDTQSIVVGIGYNDEGDTPLCAFLDPMTAEIQWEEFAENAVGQPWGISSAFFFQISAQAPVVPNDNMADATPIETLGYLGHVSNFGATLETGEESLFSCGYDNGASVWYSFSPSSTGYYTIETNYFLPDFDKVIHDFEDLGGGSLGLIGCNNNQDYKATPMAMGPVPGRMRMP